MTLIALWIILKQKQEQEGFMVLKIVLERQVAYFERENSVRIWKEIKLT